MTLRSNLERVSLTLIKGWVWDTEDPNTPVSLVVSVDNIVVGRCLASVFRADLAKAGIGDGRHAFQFKPMPPLAPLTRHVIEIRREGYGTHISKSPFVLEPPASFNQDTKTLIARILTEPNEDDILARLAFVTDIADQLRQIHADRDSDTQGRVARRRQRQRWGEVVPDATTVPESTDKPRALIVDERMPRPDHDAGSNAILSHMRALQRIGYDVTFAPASLRGDGSALASEGISCCLHPWYASIEEVLKRQRGTFALVYLHRVSTAGRYAMLVRNHQPKARLIYSVADLHHVRLARQAEVEGRPELAAAGVQMRLWELTTAWLSDAVITHSTSEAAWLRQHVAPARVHVVPWSVAASPTTVPFIERRGMAFIGGYGHKPNVDAALWLIDAILPVVEEKGEAICCLLVGSEMPEVLQGLHRHNVDPVGHVPDLATVFDRVRLTVAPLAFGAGVKGKVLDSLAAGVPCVCTPAAAEGLDLPPILLDLVASSASDIAQIIQRLHEDDALNRACSEAGLAYIRAVASEARVDDLMRSVAGMMAHDIKKRANSTAATDYK